MSTITGTDGNNTLNGTEGDDVILARGGADTINAGGGNDVINLRAAPGGSDTIDGGAGTDVVIIDSAYSSYNVAQVGGSLVFTSTVTGDTETVTNVEQFAFDDQTIFIVGAGGYASIQAAVNAAPAGATILVTAGTYNEQLVIDGKSNLTIVAVPGANVVIHAPADVSVTGLSSSGRDINAVVSVENSTNIVFSHIHVDGGGVGNTIDEGPGAGQANFVGVFYRNSTGGLDHVDITGIRDPYAGGTTVGGHPVVSGIQTGVGLQVDNDSLRAFYMHGGSITDFQKNGTVFNYANLDVTGVTVTGGGAQTINAQNGMQVANSTGHISGNTITGIGYAGPSEVYSAGVLAFDNTGLDITNNVITGSNGETTAARVVGVYVFDNGHGNSGGSITGNTISHVDEGVDVSGGLGPTSILINNNDISSVDQTDPYHAGVSFAPDGSTNDNVSGSDQDDYLAGGAGNDTLHGLGGNDTLDGGTGSDTLDGGAGTDTAVYAGPISGYSYVVAYDAHGTATGFSSVTQTSSGDTDTLTSVERLQFGNTTLDLTDKVQLLDGGGHLVGTYATIQAAVDAASDGYSIHVAAGTFADPVTVSKDVTIVGANAGVDGTGARTAETIITGGVSITANGVTFDGVSFGGEFTPGGAPFPVGVYITGDNAKIVDSLFSGTDDAVAILTGTVAGLDVGHNKFEGYAIGAYVSGTATTGSFHDNLFQGEWSLSDPDAQTGLGNGVNSESSTLTITHNIFDALYAGVVQVLADGPATLDVGTIVTDNTYTHNNAARPIQIYPNGSVTTVVGTDVAEAFNGDQASGSTRDFTFHGHGGDDRLFGGSGNDTLDGGTGNDGLFGGAGIDTAVFAGAVTANDISFLTDSDPYTNGNQAGWTVNGHAEGSDTLNGVEIVSSTTGHILLVGNGGFATIQAAVDAASDGDTILIAAGTYAEDVTVNVGVTILGVHHGQNGTDPSRAAASGVGETNIVGNWHITAASGVTVDGVRFVNDATTTGGAGNAILAVLTGGGATGHSITNDIFWSTIAGGAADDRAIQVSPIATGSVSITDNLISGTSSGQFGTAAWGRGIWSDGGGVALTVADNTTQSTRTAINLDMPGSSTATLSHNHVTNAGTFLSVGTHVDGITQMGNDLTNVDTDFNFRNITADTTFDASTAVGTVSPGTNPVVILGGSGNDTLTGTSGFDIIDANNSSNQAANDSDTLMGGAGNDWLYGRGGNDTAKYTESVTVANIAAVADADLLTAGNQAGWTVTTASGTDQLNDIEIVSSAAGHILLVGNGGFDTIQAAVDAASAGDTILVAAGNYAEDVTVNKGVTILGAHHDDAGTAASRDAAAGVGESTVIGNWHITSTADVTINGFRFVNDATTTGGPSNPPISVLTGGTTGHVITDNIFWSTIVGAANDDRAIQISPIASGAVSITNNLISGTSHGMFGTASWGRGVWSDGGGVAVTIDGNTFSWVRSDMNLDMSGDTTVTVSHNNLTNSGTGIAVGIDSDGLTVTDNNVTNVGDDFSFRNLTTDVHFNAEDAIDTLTPVNNANDYVVILGGSGNDTLTGTAGADYIDGNNHPTQGAFADNDTLYGGGGNDILYGRAGNDFLDGGTGDDMMDGGDGNDTFVVDSLQDVVVGGAGIDTVRTTTATYTLGSDVENLTAAGSPNALDGTGNALANTITGSAFDDTLQGLGGDDVIYGGDGADTILGGDNDDLLYGQVGDDILIGGNGNDLLDGGTGADVMKGGTGNDSYYVDQAGDIVQESAGQGDDIVYASIDYTLGANVERLSYTGTGSFTGTGNSLDNVITGGVGDDHLIGGAGNDVLDGGAGLDTLEGGTGDDTYYVDRRFDVVVENANEGNDTVIASGISKYRMTANVENLQTTFTGGFIGIGNNIDNHITGNIGNDFLQGKSGADTMIGDDGNDTLEGDDGADILTGGHGADTFLYNFASDSTAGSMDRITDFSHADGDRIDVSLIDAIDGGSDDDFTFIGATAFHGIAGELRTEVSGGNTFVQGDTNGDGTADFVIRLDGVVSLSNGDFIGTTTPVVQTGLPGHDKDQAASGGIDAGPNLVVNVGISDNVAGTDRIDLSAIGFGGQPGQDAFQHGNVAFAMDLGGGMVAAWNTALRLGNDAGNADSAGASGDMHAAMMHPELLHDLWAGGPALMQII